MAIIIHGKKAKKPAVVKVEAKKPMTPTERDLEEKRMAEMMYPSAAEAKKAADAAKGITS